MIIFLTDQQQERLSRDLERIAIVSSELVVLAKAFQTISLSGPQHNMVAAAMDLTHALRSIAKTMQDASGMEQVAVVDEKMGDGV